MNIATEMDDTEHYQAAYHRNIAPDEPYSSAIVNTVADVRNCDPTELPEILYNAVDTDAVDMMFSRSREASNNEMSLSFGYCDHLVTVFVDRTLQIKPKPTDHRPISDE